MVFLFQSKPNYFWYIYISQAQIQSKAFFFSPRASFIFHERKLKQCFDAEIKLFLKGGGGGYQVVFLLLLFAFILILLYLYIIWPDLRYRDIATLNEL